MGVGELLAEKEARARRNAELFERGGRALLALVVLAGWCWTLYLVLLAGCEVRHGSDDCADRTWTTVRVGLVTTLLTAGWLLAVTTRRIRELEAALADRDAG